MLLHAKNKQIDTRVVRNIHRKSATLMMMINILGMEHSFEISKSQKISSKLNKFLLNSRKFSLL